MEGAHMRAEAGHLGADDIQRALHNELPPERDADLRRHLDACSECAAALAEAEREETEVYGALGALDHPAPAVSASAILAAGEGAVRSGLARAGVPRASWMRWAAGIVLGLGIAGVAYAAPGSPLRDWIGALTERTSPSPEPPSSAPAQAAGGGGVGVAPGDRFVVELSGVETGGAVWVLFTDEAVVEVETSSGRSQLMFTSAPGQLVVWPVATDTIRLEIPRTAPRVEVTSAGRTIAVAESGTLLVEGATVAGPGPFILTPSAVSP
jgi:hypothetical protein